ncbi:DUF397 domain-containing protein [Streptomyces sp. FH025]|nr:DUF397 domain-containing protein [Streptomyces sp. FH025]
MEVALAEATVQVRDSKDRTGPQLAFTAQAWADFIGFARNEGPEIGVPR